MSGKHKGNAPGAHSLGASAPVSTQASFLLRGGDLR
jgi:hypothetical protein